MVQKAGAVLSLVDGFKARDYSGKPLMDVTPGESAGYCPGFQPTKLTEWNAARRSAVQAQTQASNRGEAVPSGAGR